MKKLGVCGDSFMASMNYDSNNLDNGYDKHFTEILAKKIKCEITTFARVGCDNQTIRLQIDEIIKEQPDCVIIGLTSPDRVVLSKKYNSIFKINDGLYNIDYSNKLNISSNRFKNYNGDFISTPIFSIFSTNSDLFTDKELSNLEFCYERFFDYNWKLLQDSWIISDGLRKLQDHNIPFFCINHFLNDKIFENFGDSIIDSHSELNPWNYNDKINKYWFHTTLESQEILANKWYNLFLKKDLIKLI